MDLSAHVSERISGELEMALLKAEHPSVFFRVLRQMDQLYCWFP
jgi:tRNA nucleotidyltransferase/poly(A) polymerase